jgi:hypothetical protein
MNAPSPLQHRPFRLAFGLCLALAVTNLLAGMGGGLSRLGVPLPLATASALHGVLLVDGVFGTLVALRWAWAIGRVAALVPALLAAAAGVAALLGVEVDGPLWAWLVAGAGAVLLQLIVAARHRWRSWIAIDLLGSLAWCLGTLLWLQGGLAHDALLAWMSFIVLAFVGERRRQVHERALGAASHVWFGIAVALPPLACVAALLRDVRWMPRWGWVDTPTLLFWLGALMLALWSLRHDLQRLRTRPSGWAAMIAQALALGDAWLLAAALLGLLGRWLFTAASGPAWHALLVGFGLSSALGLIPAPQAPARQRVFWLQVALWALSVALALRIATAGFQHPAALAASGVALATAIALIAAVGLRSIWASAATD